MKLLSRVLLSSALIASLQVTAQEPEPGPNPDDSAPSCKSADILSSKLFTDINWDGVFPIRIAGTTIFSSSNATPPPDGASNDAVCACLDDAGVPMPGYTMSMWQPSKLHELTLTSGCSPSLGGITLPLSDVRRKGTTGSKETNFGQNNAFYHAHYFTFPLMVMLGMNYAPTCHDGFSDFDLAFMSEVNPVWNNEVLSAFTFPQSTAVANPVATAACAIDAVSSNAGKPLTSMWWCQGSWGTMYNLSGDQDSALGKIGIVNSLATKQLALLHHLGLARKSYGPDNMCYQNVSMMIPKEQYKYSHIWPVPEATSSHLIGQSVLQFGGGKSYPGGEDNVMMQFNWTDCCVTGMDN